MARPGVVISIEKARASQSVVREAVLTHLDDLYRFALRMTRDTEQAKDLIQETAVRALDRQNTVIHKPRAWLFQTLYHVFVSQSRTSKQRERHQESSSSDETEPAGVADLLPTLMAREDVRRAVESLQEEFRAVVWLSDAEEFRLQEIAEILGCPLGTVASRLARGRRELRRLLATYGREQET